MTEPTGATGECKDCGKQVRFVITVGGALIPIGLMPVPVGNVVMVQTRSGMRAKIVGGGKGMPDDGPFYEDHRSTCPNREHARRKGLSKPAVRPKAQSLHRCKVCGQPLDRFLADVVGERTHPSCSTDPQGRA